MEDDFTGLSESIRKKARNRVNQKKGVYIHMIAIFAASVILIVMAFLVGNPIEFWLIFPLLPMALSILIHYTVVFGIPGTGIMSEDWEEEQMDLEMWKLYMQKRRKILDSENPDELELKELKKVKKSWSDEEFV